MRQVTYIFIILLIFLGMAFSYLNPGDVSFNYYFDNIVIAKPLFILIAVAVGFCFGLLFTLIIYIKLKRTNYKLKNKIALANKELDNLRTMPIRDHH